MHLHNLWVFKEDKRGLQRFKKRFSEPAGMRLLCVYVTLIIVIKFGHGPEYRLAGNFSDMQIRLKYFSLNYKYFYLI